MSPSAKISIVPKRPEAPLMGPPPRYPPRNSSPRLLSPLVKLPLPTRPASPFFEYCSPIIKNLPLSAVIRLSLHPAVK